MVEKTSVTHFSSLWRLSNRSKLRGSLKEVYCVSSCHLVQVESIRLITAEIECHLLLIRGILLRASEFLR